MTSGGPCCACLSVSYEPEQFEQGVRDRWVCDACGGEFVRGAFADYWDQKAADEMAVLRHRLVADKAIKAHLSAEYRNLREAIDLDISDAEVNCGKFNEKKDCSAYIDRGLTCSDCPVTWFFNSIDAVSTRQKRMDELGITEQDIAETMSPRPESER